MLLLLLICPARLQVSVDSCTRLSGSTLTKPDLLRVLVQGSPTESENAYDVSSDVTKAAPHRRTRRRPTRGLAHPVGLA